MGYPGGKHRVQHRARAGGSEPDRPADQQGPASPLTAATMADRPDHTDGDRRAAGDLRQAAARAARPEDDAQRDPGGARCERHPAIDLGPKRSWTGAVPRHPRSSANASAVNAPLPARPWTRPTVSGRETSVRTTGGGRGRRTRDCGPMCARWTATAAPGATTIARAGGMQARRDARVGVAGAVEQHAGGVVGDLHRAVHQHAGLRRPVHAIRDTRDRRDGRARCRRAELRSLRCAVRWSR
jgi:hypothetical protein